MTTTTPPVESPGSVTPDARPVTPSPLDGRRAQVLPGAVVLALFLAAAVCSSVVVLTERADWWRPLKAAAVASSLAALLSIVPLTWGLRRDVYKAVTAFFAAMAIRGAVSLGGCALAVFAADYPPAPTMLLMLVFYVAVLLAETAVVVRCIWDARG